MTKPVEEREDRRILTTEEEPKLEKLGLSDQLKAYRKYAQKEAEAASEKKAVLDLIGAILSSVKADGAVWTDSKGREWRAAAIPGNPDAKRTDANKLRRNIARMGGLDTKLVARIYEASQIEVPREGYVRVTLPKDD